MFTPAMVRALRGGVKTQTRRKAIGRGGKPTLWTKAQPGDRLWVREAHRLTDHGAIYKGDGDSSPGRWRPALHMPRHASRMTLVVTDSRIEPVQRISEADARAEGMVVRGSGAAQLNFKAQWVEMHGATAWVDDPEVVVLTFRVVHRNIDTMD